MGFVSMSGYDANVVIPVFKGLNQADIGLNPDIRYAAEEENVETPHGVLQPQAAPIVYPGEFEGRVETLAVLHRRWYTSGGSHTWYIAACNGKLYQKQADSGIDWAEILLPVSLTIASNLWSCVTYEINESQNTVDVLLMSNAEDGMIMVIPPDRPSTIDDYAAYTIEELANYTFNQLASASWTVRTVYTHGIKFGTIERYGERIWGGCVNDDPDLLMYSAPYDPLNWEPDLSTPEAGAGDVRQPSWDGDKFYALRRFGDHLLSIKRNRIWRVFGLSPGEYTFQEQFGEGTEYLNTIAIDTERMYMCGPKGVIVYDGMSTTPYARPQIEQIWRTINKDALDQMCAALYQQKYYLAFPTGNSDVNNSMLVYDFVEGSILLYTDFHIEAFLNTDGHLFATSSTLPGRILLLDGDSWTNGEARNAPVRWVSPWMDFGQKKVQKGGFDLYFIPEVQEEAVELIFTIETEKKAKTKRYTVLPTDKEHRGKRLHFGGAGRKFRIIIETAGSAAPWRLIGGLQLVVETDPD